MAASFKHWALRGVYRVHKWGPFLRVGFVGFLNCRYGFLRFYVGFFVSVLFPFWTSPGLGEFFMLGGGGGGY